MWDSVWYVRHLPKGSVTCYTVRLQSAVHSLQGSPCKDENIMDPLQHGNFRVWTNAYLNAISGLHLLQFNNEAKCPNLDLVAQNQP